MIRSLDIKNPKETPIKWLGDVAALKEPRTFEFKPGLNILWGRNGSGKTTVLKLLARLFHCEQSGAPVVTQSSVGDLFEIGSAADKVPNKLLKSVIIDHDGQGVRHLDPGHAAGLFAGGAAFDDDFIGLGVMNTMFKGSAGQTTMFRFDQLMGSFLKNRCAPEVEYRMKKSHVNSLWSERIELIEKFLEGSGEKGPATVMMDEPERSFDLPMQVQCWRFLRAYSQKAQFIVASHSMFALNIPEAHYFEMDPGYLDASKAAVALLPTWADEKPFTKTPASSEEPPKAKKVKKSESEK
jgi:predicted ATPase